MFKAFLLPIDLAAVDGCRKACSVAAEMAKAHGAALHVVSVVPDFGLSIVGAQFEAGYEKRALEETEAQLKTFCAATFEPDLAVHPHVAHGSIYAEIMRAANRLGCDAIVISAHRPELRDYLLGPNAARVVRHADQSVFVIRD